MIGPASTKDQDGDDDGGQKENNHQNYISKHANTMCKLKHKRINHRRLSLKSTSPYNRDEDIFDKRNNCAEYGRSSQLGVTEKTISIQFTNSEKPNELRLGDNNGNKKLILHDDRDDNDDDDDSDYGALDVMQYESQTDMYDIVDDNERDEPPSSPFAVALPYSSNDLLHSCDISLSTSSLYQCFSQLFLGNDDNCSDENAITMALAQRRFQSSVNDVDDVTVENMNYAFDDDDCGVVMLGTEIWEDEFNVAIHDQEPNILNTILSINIINNLRRKSNNVEGSDGTAYSSSFLRDDNVWLRYSLRRDGASLTTLLSKVKHSHRTILVVETLDGDIFGSFTSNPWRRFQQRYQFNDNGDDFCKRTNEYYGSGESFLWRRRQQQPSVNRYDDDIEDEKDTVEVFHWTGCNRNFQLVTTDKLIVGGGTPELVDSFPSSLTSSDRDYNDWGFGLALNEDLSRGSSSRCATYGCPGLLSFKDGGDEVFDIINVEVWELTPVDTVERAQQLELARKMAECDGGWKHGWSF